MTRRYGLIGVGTGWILWSVAVLVFGFSSIEGSGLIVAGASIAVAGVILEYIFGGTGDYNEP